MDLIKDLFEDRGLKACILNLEEIKGKLEEETKGPYQNVFLQEIGYMNVLVGIMVNSLTSID